MKNLHSLSGRAARSERTRQRFAAREVSRFAVQGKSAASSEKKAGVEASLIALRFIAARRCVSVDVALISRAIGRLLQVVEQISLLSVRPSSKKRVKAVARIEWVIPRSQYRYALRDGNGALDV